MHTETTMNVSKTFGIMILNLSDDSGDKITNNDEKSSSTFGFLYLSFNSTMSIS